jgi:uncharacterized membrane protein
MPMLRLISNQLHFAKYFRCNEHRFFTIFLAEMIIKLIGLGLKTYIKDRFNIFDAIIGKFPTL